MAFIKTKQLLDSKKTLSVLTDLFSILSVVNSATVLGDI